MGASRLLFEKGRASAPRPFLFWERAMAKTVKGVGAPDALAGPEATTCREAGNSMAAPVTQGGEASAASAKVGKARKTARGTPGKAVLHGGARPRVQVEKAGSWTAAKRKAFLAELAATCNVKRSARAAGMHESGVYQLRARSAEFRAQWAAALDEGYAKLELMMLERAMNGTMKKVTRAGGVVDRFREYSDATALQLLKAHKDRRPPSSDMPEEDVEAVRKRILKKLEIVARREAKKA
ncbi:hypothetical protein [Allosphingosinicella vermicomposti]|uniref:hypothetical protein n=1 Tax=Allosphingosinicella vermicomposti TaxID=614671 RepID=UPI000D0EEEA1|nr:hypothetical protein [Allosphingosinicella vermicomposti]